MSTTTRLTAASTFRAAFSSTWSRGRWILSGQDLSDSSSNRTTSCLVRERESESGCGVSECVGVNV